MVASAGTTNAGHRRRPRRRRRRRARSSASGCTSTARTAARAGGAERPGAVRRHRAGRQLHRRPAQVAVRPVRLLRPALPRAGAGPGRARPDTPATWTPIDRESGTPADLAAPSVPAGPRPAVLVQPRHARHRPLHGRHRADARDTARAVADGIRRTITAAEIDPAADAVGGPVRTAGLERRATTSEWSSRARAIEGVHALRPDPLAGPDGRCGWRSSIPRPTPITSSRCSGPRPDNQAGRATPA